MPPPKTLALLVAVTRSHPVLIIPARQEAYLQGSVCSPAREALLECRGYPKSPAAAEPFKNHVATLLQRTAHGLEQVCTEVENDDCGMTLVCR